MALAIHFEYHGTHVHTTHYCQPSVGANLQSTTDRAEVTCKHCLAKLATMPQEHSTPVATPPRQTR